MQQQHDVSETVTPPQELWLGYDGLVVPFALISALLVYQPAWERRITHDYGWAPADARAVVLLTDGRVLPSRRALAEIHARWTDWQARQAGDRSAETKHDVEHDVTDDRP